MYRAQEQLKGGEYRAEIPGIARPSAEGLVLLAWV